jgi:hypothetical protein
MNAEPAIGANRPRNASRSSLGGIVEVNSYRLNASWMAWKASTPAARAGSGEQSELHRSSSHIRSMWFAGSPHPTGSASYVVTGGHPALIPDALRIEDS